MSETPKYKSYKKSAEYVEVYEFDGSKESADIILEVLEKKEIQYKLTETPINIIGQGKFYHRHIEIIQDNNVYNLYKSNYMVLDNLNTVSTYTEVRFNKLFDRVYPNIY